MAQMIGECALCGRYIADDDVEDCWKEVKGYVGGPKKDSMVLRQYTGRAAHASCVEKARMGQAVDQPTIEDALDSPPDPVKPVDPALARELGWH